MAFVPATGSTAPLPSGFGWDGGSGTTWRSNPQSGVTGILFTRRQAVSPAPPPVVEDFWTAVNAATTGWRAVEPRRFSAVGGLCG
jgi:hypothetical protein